MSERRDRLTVLKNRKAEIEAKRAKLDGKADPLEQAIAIAEEQQRKEEDGYLGAVVRHLLDEPELKRLLSIKAAQVYPQRAKRARKVLERVLGPLPASRPEFAPSRSDLKAVS